MALLKHNPLSRISLKTKVLIALTVDALAAVGAGVYVALHAPEPAAGLPIAAGVLSLLFPILAWLDPRGEAG